MKKPKRYDRRYLPMLWIGLGLWVGGMLLSFILEKMGSALSGQETLMELSKVLFQRMPVFTLLLMCLFQPVLEELSFRLWGVGKLWTAIICITLMAAFTIASIGLWGIPLIAAFVVVYFGVKPQVPKMWLTAIISSLSFTLCHISGFGALSAGMVLGLVDIFGLAMVLAWLAINVNFWLAALLHVLNNSIALLSTLLLLHKPVSTESFRTLDDGTRLVRYHMTIEPVRPFAGYDTLTNDDFRGLIMDSSWMEGAYYDVLTLIGEPAEIAFMLTNAMNLGNPLEEVYYDWASRNEGMEERIVLRVDQLHDPNMDPTELLSAYVDLVNLYQKKPLVRDTTEVMLQEAWLIYDDGREVLFDENCPDLYVAMERITFNSYGLRGNDLISRMEEVDDTSVVERFYVRMRPNPLEDQMPKQLNSLTDNLYGYRIEYRDAKPATFITWK